MKAAVGLLASALLLSGCAAVSSTPDCTSGASFGLSVYAVDPLTNIAKPFGSANHSSTPPGNQQQFLAQSSATNRNAACPIPLVIALVRPQWTVSDSVNVTISSANDSTNGLATCLGATLTPATVTATLTSGGVTKSTSTTLTCY